MYVYINASQWINRMQIKINFRVGKRSDSGLGSYKEPLTLLLIVT